MRELSLSGNAKFSSIPSSAESWTKLEILNMQKCQGFKQLPTFAENWLELKEIDVRAAKKQVFDFYHILLIDFSLFLFL